jgi:hypothetical protein
MGPFQRRLGGSPGTGETGTGLGMEHRTNAKKSEKLFDTSVNDVPDGVY